jgi:hypothetical protein
MELTRLRGFLMHRRLQLFCTAVLFFSYAYFYPGQGWNQNSRFDLTRAIVEEHTISIDSFHKNTGDKAFYNGHYYSDKAPGLALAAVPIWAATRTALKITGKTTATGRALGFGLDTASLATVALPTVIALVLLFSAAVKMGASPSGAAFGVLAVGLGTPTWSHATLFWGHAAAGSFLVFAFIAALALRMPSSRSLLLGLTVGVTGGWATLIEYPAAPAAALLAGYALCNAWQFQRRMVGRVATGILCGALANIIVLGVYNRLAFGSPTAISYTYNVNFPQMRIGFFGATYPRLEVLRHLLFASQRGLLFLAPVVIFATVGLWILWKRRKLDCLILGAIPLYYLLFNASYVNWIIRYSYGPRLLAAGLFFLVIPLAMAWTAGGRKLRTLLAGSAAIGAGLALIAESTSVTPPDWNQPISHLIQAFLTDQIPIRNGTNAGILLGLNGRASLVPLLFLWLAAAVCLRTCGKYRTKAADEFN